MSRKQRDISWALPPSNPLLKAYQSGISEKTGSKSVARSMALQYEVELKEHFEMHPKCPGRDRVKKAFDVLDQIVPTLGALTPVVKTIRDELFKSVYSKNLTSSEEDPFVERIPYFSVAGKVDDERTEVVSKVGETISELQQKLKFREHDLQMLYKKNMALKQEIADKEITAKILEDKIKSLQEQLHRLEMEKGELRIYHSTNQDQLKREIDKLQTSLAQANHIIEKLTVFKTTYDDKGGDEMIETERENGKLELNIDSIGMVEYDLYQAEKLDDQFAEILNLQLDDFELALSQLRKKKEILLGVMSSEAEKEASYKLEMHEIVVGFKKRVSDLLEEQRLLRNHSCGLKIIFDDYVSNKKTIQRTADTNLRKYSIILQISKDNGERFDHLKSTKFCSKCGDKTISCPHRTLNESPIELPAGVTHIKVTRPLLRLRTDYIPPDKRMQVIMADSEEPPETEDEVLETTRTMKILWEEFYERRGGVKPKLVRKLTEDKILTLIQEIYDSRWYYEEERPDIRNEEEIVLSRFNDFFYDFMFQRYQMPEVAKKAVHDILTGLAEFEEKNPNVAIFIRHLAHMDDSVWKYLYLARKLLVKHESATFGPAKYRQILSIMYPSRSREIYDQMELEFIAFTKNKFTKELVEEHLLHMLQEEIEPNGKFFTYGLKRVDYRESGTLSYEDFDEAMVQLLPAAPTRLKRVRYLLVEQEFRKEQVPIERLAKTASLILLYCCYKNSWAPQAIMSSDIADSMLGRGSNDALGPTNQDEVDKLLGETNHNVLDAKAIEEEELRLMHRRLNEQDYEVEEEEEEEDDL